MRLIRYIVHSQGPGGGGGLNAHASLYPPKCKGKFMNIINTRTIVVYVKYKLCGVAYPNSFTIFEDLKIASLKMEEESVFPETALAPFRRIIFYAHPILQFEKKFVSSLSISSRIKTLRLEKSLNLQQMTAAPQAKRVPSVHRPASKVGVANFTRE